MKDAYHSSNYVKLDNIFDDAVRGNEDGGPLAEELASSLKGLIRMHGGRECIVECAEMLDGCVRTQVFDELLATWDLVESCGYAGYIGVDFSLLGSFDYYTGLIFEAFVQGLGMSIGGGGRYDGLLEVFGKSMPAAGFAFSLENLMHALAADGMLELEPGEKNHVDGNDANAFARAMRMHAQGKVATLGGSK